MDALYYWNTLMPVQKDRTISPSDYFKSLLYTAEDHFSYIAPDYTELMGELNGVQKEAGYDFTLGLISKDSVAGVVNYIKPNSPASLTALKRGDIFLTVNGKQLMTDNYGELINEMSAPHTLGIYRGSATSLQSISLSVTEYKENPVFLDSIYQISGKKIAYLIYNFFASDNGDNSYSYLKELNNIFGKFKQANVNELVLDLRYDGGGDAEVATALGSMISGKGSSDLFYTEQYNSIVDNELKKKGGADYNKTFFNNNLILRDANGKIIDQSIPVNKLTGLSRLYVLTSQNTASASELIINGLKPYMNVILVGEQTYGKNVGMWFIYETDPQKQKDNHWGMLPIVFKLYNSQNSSDYSKGFVPNIAIDEYSLAQMLPLGNTGEALLSAALTDMGVQASIAFRSAGKQFDYRPLMSSIDRTPVRRNVIAPHKRLPNAFNRSSSVAY
jgi:C-terminal processing protease CtpA/Prc